MPIKTIIEPFRIKSTEAIVWRKREQNNPPGKVLGALPGPAETGCKLRPR